MRPRGVRWMNAELEQVRLVDVLDRVGLLAERDGERRQPHRAAAELVDDRRSSSRSVRSRPSSSTSSSSSASSAISGVIAPAWRTSATSRTRRRIRFATRGVPRERRAISSAASSAISTPRIRGRAHARSRASSRGLVVAEPERHSEAVAQRRGQQPGARRRADQRERRQVERQRARSRPLADDDVEAKVLERRVEDLLDGAVQPVDLVDEQDVARLERGEDRGEVALALERRARDGADPDAELLADDVREASSSRARAGRRAGRDRAPRRAPSPPSARPRAAPSTAPGRRTRPGARGRSERSNSSSSVRRQHRREELLAHAAFLSAWRTRSSGGSSGSTSASACSASTSV